MDSAHALLAGAAIGLTVAAPVGPMAILVIHRTLSRGFSAGLATGAGASTINLIYAAVGICGLDRLANFMTNHNFGLHAMTSCMLVGLAVWKVYRPSAVNRTSNAIGATVLSHYASAIAFNSINPLGFVVLCGALAAITGLAAQEQTATLALVGGVFLGSITWWITLVAVTAAVGVRLSPARTRILDLAAASFLVVLATYTMARLV